MLFVGRHAAIAQEMISSKAACLISFSIHFSSNLVDDINSSTYYNLYLITSEKDVPIDDIMFELSKKNYMSESRILDTLNSYFKVYTIVEDTCREDTNVDKVAKVMFDYNNYTKGYYFKLNEEVQKNGPVIGFIIQRCTLNMKIWYSVVNKNCGTYLHTCRAMIRKLE
jgi:ribosome-interacting GTPase 1